MKRIRPLLALLAAFAALTAASASASVFTSGLSYNGVPDVIQDNSVSLALFDNNGDNLVNAGDVIAGIIKWNTNISTGNDFGATTVAVFSAQVKTAPAATGRTIGGDPALNFGVGAVDTVTYPGSAFATLSNLLSGKPAFDPRTIAVILSNTGGANPTLTNFGAALADLNTASWTIDASFGIMTSTDFFSADIRDHHPNLQINISDTDGDGYIDEFDDFFGTGPGGIMTPGIAETGAEAGAFSVIINNLGAGLIPVQSVTLSGVLGPTADLALSATLLQPTDLQLTNGYRFADQSVVTLNPLPEPASILAWLGLIAGFGLLRRRRK